MNDKETLKGVIDRFEGDWAVIELDGESEPRNVSRKLVPKRAKEGDYLQFEVQDGQIIRVQPDKAATEAAKKRIQNKLEKLRRGDHLHNED